jgi:hypothetical protein
MDDEALRDKKPKRLSRALRGLKSLVKDARSGKDERAVRAGESLQPQSGSDGPGVQSVTGDASAPLDYHARAGHHGANTSTGGDLDIFSGTKRPTYGVPDLRWREQLSTRESTAEADEGHAAENITASKVDADNAEGENTIKGAEEHTAESISGSKVDTGEASAKGEPSSTSKSVGADAGAGDNERRTGRRDSDNDGSAPSAPTHTDASGRTSYLSPPTPGYTTPGYEWASASRGYDWDARKQFYGTDNPTMGEAYERELRRRDLHLETVRENMQKLKEDAIKTTERRIGLGYAYHS